MSEIMTDRIAPTDALPEYEGLKLKTSDPNLFDVAGLQSAVHEVAATILVQPIQEIDPTDVHVESRGISLPQVERWSETDQFPANQR